MYRMLTGDACDCLFAHTDKNPGDKTAEKMYVELNNAYEVLGDNQKRKQYDMFGEDGLRNGGGDDDQDGFDPFGSMFGGAFGGGRRRQQREERRVADLVVPLSVDLEMLYNGGLIEASHKRRILCHSWSDCEKKCSKCGGRGVVIQTRRLGPGFVQQIQTTCPVCSGTGKIGTPNCKSCPHGQFEEVEKLLMIDLEPGMPDGHSIAFEGETDEVPEHQPGNILFQIDTLEHPRFTRMNNDLHYDLTVTLTEALVGVDRRVKQLDGRLVAIRTTNVVTPNDEIIIKGEGMPSFEGSAAGDMVVKFWVRFPESLTKEQKLAAISLHGKPPSVEETGDGVADSGSNANDDADEGKSEL